MKLKSIFFGSLLAICAISLSSCDKTKSQVNETVSKIEEATLHIQSASSTAAVEDYYNDVEEAVHELVVFYKEKGEEPSSEVKNKIDALLKKAHKEYSRAYNRITGEYVEP